MCARSSSFNPAQTHTTKKDTNNNGGGGVGGHTEKSSTSSRAHILRVQIGGSTAINFTNTNKIVVSSCAKPRSPSPSTGYECLCVCVLARVCLCECVRRSDKHLYNKFYCCKCARARGLKTPHGVQKDTHGRT